MRGALEKFGVPLASRRLSPEFRARVCIFARPTIAIAKIRDYSQSSVRRLHPQQYHEKS